MKQDILSMTPEELREFTVSELGEAKYRADQIWGFMYKGEGFDGMSNLPKKLREALTEKAELRLPTIALKLVSQVDGTVKYLFELIDGQRIESVVMRYKYGLTICISSQCGCRMGCRFCASTIGGKVRDLTPSELLGQIIAAQKDLGERISHVVMMGIGEPLDNYDNVIKFLRLVNMEKGLCIGYRNISLSTCGVVPKIDKLAEESFPITLSISLHAPDDESRSAIMPVNNAWGVDELLSACRRYFDVTGRRISFEYTLISGKNDSVEDAVKLATVLKKYMKDGIHVNLIPLNEVAERDFKRGRNEDIKRFCDTLGRHGVNATVRRRLGPDINASCGQLRRNGNISAE
ncbi:MAG: 23S rRNA (adenine(2503)-C(2))-methyltransferase RlmN [Clostridia bacterium]|nr:23S rRNA (adenine(2503)-C(2))-methyltransferase RlmN [Clostridia bacterium]